MASKHPVPSRAALNALRGVILTTSCSVILLAEERRRRLRLARAALENARKLHMVQSNRGPIAVAESHGPWEGRFVEIDDQVLSMASLPRPRTSTRRRGRSHLIGTNSESEFPESDGGRAQSISSAGKESAMAIASGKGGLLGHGLDMVNMETLSLSSSKRHNYNDLEWKAPRVFVPNGDSKTSTSIEQPTPGVKTTSSHLAQKPQAADKYEFNMVDTEPYLPEPVAAARLYLEKSSGGALAVRPFYDDAIQTLEQLLKDIETSDTSKSAFSERVDLAVAVFKRVASFGPPLPRAAKPLLGQGIRLLQLISTSSPDKLTATLITLLPISKDPLKLLVPFMACAQRGGSHKVVHNTLLFLSQNARSYSWARGMLVCRLLARHAKAQPQFDHTKRLYRLVQDAGLFGEIHVPASTEYRIRRLMTILALEKGDEAFAKAELGVMLKLDAVACNSDIRLQTLVITRKATLNLWSEVFADIEALGQVSNIQCLEFQRLLTKITDSFAHSHNAHELENLLRKVAVAYKLALKHRWIYAVLDHYASRRQTDAVFSWLQFCSSTGLQMDSAFNRRLFTRCRKYWSFSDKTIQSLEAHLQQSRSVKEASKATLSPIAATNRSDLAKRMECLASDGQWTGVAEAYEMARSAGTESSIECLRLAVLACTKGPTTNIDHADTLIQSAYEKGHDIGEALTPLLLAKLERGDDPSWLINNVLRVGVRVHDSVYNKAAQALSAMGNHQAAADMCETAAKENGNGKLLYNEYNFSNLVFAYTGSARYRTLQSLLSGFTSDVQWWHGSRVCKETIKLAMKTAAMRAVAHSQDSASHREALDNLDDALIHVKKCRSTRDDRRAVSEACVRLAAVPPTKAPQKANYRFSGKASKIRREQGAFRSTEPVNVAVAANSG